jgi:uncharacterized membrane-anchored protein
MTLQPGYLLATAVFAVLFLVLSDGADSCYPLPRPLYWAVIVTTTVGTTLADLADPSASATRAVVPMHTSD